MVTFWVVLLLSYIYHGTGITVGYHRLLSHKAFKCPKWVEYFIVSGGYLALEGSPIAWVSTHRQHHRYSDLPGDPHSPMDGVYHAFVGWLPSPIVRLSGHEIEQIVPDLQRDPVYRFFDFNHTRNHAWVCLGLSVLLRVVIFITLGPLAVLANVIGALIPFIGPFWVNSVCHMPEFGYRNFITQDSSRNVWWVGLIALGEGWHNNHHAHPQSARHGLKLSEFDLSWVFIKFLSAIGCATDIRLPKGSASTPVIDQALARQLGVPCVTETAVVAEQLTRQLQEQLTAARALSMQLIIAGENLTEQVRDAKAELVSTKKGQVSGQFNPAGSELTDQLISACDRLSDELTQAKTELGQQFQAKSEPIALTLLPDPELETAIR